MIWQFESRPVGQLLSCFMRNLSSVIKFSWPVFFKRSQRGKCYWRCVAWCAPYIGGRGSASRCQLSFVGVSLCLRSILTAVVLFHSSPCASFLCRLSWRCSEMPWRRSEARRHKHEKKHSSSFFFNLCSSHNAKFAVQKNPRFPLDRWYCFAFSPVFRQTVRAFFC